MVKTMSIECPSCSQSFTLYLSLDTSMVILDCPMCCTSIIYYKNRTFPLTKNQIERIKNCKQESNVLKILHRITAQEPKVHCAKPQAAHCYAEVACLDRHIPLVKSHLDHITHDDIINLRIELETCRDSGHFITRM